MRKSAPINVIVYYPKTEAGKEDLAKRVSEVHANAAIRRIKELTCPPKQKQELVDAVIATVRQRSGEPSC